MAKNDYIRLTKQMVERLESLKAASGVGVVTLCQQKLASWPGHRNRTLTPSVVNGWLSGAIKNADPVCYRAVVSAYESLLDNNEFAALRPRHPKNRVEIDAEMRRKLRFVANSCRRSSIAALLKRRGAPSDLTADKFSKALHGRTETLLRSHAEHISQLYEALSQTR